MYLFILGVILGIGLTLAVRSLDKTWRLRKMRQRVQLEAEIEERIIARNNAWDASTGWPGPGQPKRPGWDDAPHMSKQFQPIRHP